MSEQLPARIEDDIREILLSAELIESKVAQLGEEISRDYEGKDLLLVCIL